MNAILYFFQKRFEGFCLSRLQAIDAPLEVRVWHLQLRQLESVENENSRNSKLASSRDQAGTK